MKLSLILTIAIACFPNVATAQQSVGIGEVVIANISPEVARNKAKEMALLDLIQQEAGVNVSSHELIVNSNMASYHFLQTQNARVIDSECEYQIKQINDIFFQVARCIGEVQRFGENAPALITDLIPLGANPDCNFSMDTERVLTDHIPFFKSHQHFCIHLRSHEEQYAVVFTIYQEDEEIKICRLFPDGDSKSLQIGSGTTTNFPPLASSPLPNQNFSQEAILVLHGREPINADLLVNCIVGSTAKETDAASASIDEFDRNLRYLDLNSIGISIAPFAIAN